MNKQEELIILLDTLRDIQRASRDPEIFTKVIKYVRRLYFKEQKRVVRERLSAIIISVTSPLEGEKSVLHQREGLDSP